LWLCLDQRFRYIRCRPGSGGVTPGSDLQIWRGHR
jgi:ribonuclease T2